MDNYKILLTVAILLVIFLFSYKIKEKFEADCKNEAPNQDMGATAKEACNRISTRAQEIEAQHSGAADIIKAITGFLNPQNYKAGNNTTDNIMRNIINTNLSSCEIQKIQNDCINNTAVSQSNIIDNSTCRYCDNNDCSILSNIIQTNNTQISQTCTIQSLIETLTKKTNSIDSQALAQVLQKADGLLSGSNSFKNENCNVISADLSTTRYLEKKFDCSNTLKVDQENTIKNCSPVAARVVQKNNFQTFQSCMSQDEITNSTSIEEDIKTKQDLEAKQESSGFNLGMSAISGLICCSAFIVSGVALFYSEDIIGAVKK